ncbi:MAG TPA: VOC family protein [Dehalococcoidia bacterium]|nr:VOC family protein [Dehalococcoidia bacterium]
MARITALSFIVPVRDLDRAAAFYEKAFGLTVGFRADRIVFVGNEGTDTAVGLLLDPEHAGAGPMNVGLHVDHAVSPDDAVRDVEAAGGTVVERGQHAPDVPYARIADPDGNVLWI